jgi:hypothetical protein
MDSYLQPNENAYTNAEKRLRNFEQKRRALMINIEDAKKTQYAAFVKRMKKKGYQVGPDGEVISATGKFLGNFEDGVEEVRKIETKEVKEDPQDKVLFGEDIMTRYGPGGKDNDPSDNYDADADTTDAVAARQQSFDPNYTDLADDVSAQPSSAGTNKTSTRDKLNVGPARMGRIERENRARLGDERVDFLKQRQRDFKSMNKKDFAKKYPKSQTAKRLKIRR